MKIENIISLIKKGENVNIEFKEKPARIGEEIVGMANAEGGYIIVGVNDDGEVVGCDANKVIRIINSLLQSIFPLVKLDIKRVIIDKKEIVVIDIKKSERFVSLGGIGYIRVGTTIRPLSLQEIFWLGAEQGEYKYDEVSSKVEFKLNRIVIWFKKILAKRRKVEIKKYLRSIKAVVRKNDKLYFTNGGSLFFLETPQNMIPHSGARIVIVDEKGEPVRHIEFKGPIWKIADEITKWFGQNLEYRNIIIGMKRERVLEYPLRALREGVMNALAHRNYAIESDIRIFVHKNFIRIRNPGSLMPGVNLDEPEHVPRNPVLCQLLFDIGYIEKYGYGIRMIRDCVDAHPLTTVKFKPKRMYFDVIFAKEKYMEVIDDIDKKILLLVEKPFSSSYIAKKIGMTRQAIVSRLNKLVSLSIIKKIGRGPRVKYIKS